MRVMVTGGTGFVGAHSVRALVDAGHEVRLLVRSPDRIDANVKPLGVDASDYVVGDMVDESAVGRALDGCDAVLHCAALVSLDRRRAANVIEANTRGTKVVIGEALARGLDPIVYTSSTAALFTPGITLMHEDLPPALFGRGYGRSKAEAETYVRARQQDGCPITSTYPSGIVGPPAGTAFGELGDAIAKHLKAGLLPSAGAISLVDVRDVAAVHAAAMQPGKGPRRYMCAGRYLSMRDLAALYRELTGRRFPVVPMPGAALRGVGRLMDGVRRFRPSDSVFSVESMTILTRWAPSDDRGIVEELGITPRDMHETLADAIRGLYAAGVVTTEQSGDVADTRAAGSAA